MKGKWFLSLGLVVVLLLAVLSGMTTAQEPDGSPLTSMFTYQGRLKINNAPYSGFCDLQFGLWDELSGGTQVGEDKLLENIELVEGYFTVVLDWLEQAFVGEKRFLDITARCPAGSGTWEPLSPRLELTSTPYALYAKRSPWPGLLDVPAGFADGVDNDTTYFAGPGLVLTDVIFSADFAILQRRVAGVCGTGFAIREVFDDGNVLCEPVGGGGGAAWQLTGNTGTTPGVNYLGTNDNQPLLLKVNAQRALRLEPNATSPNIIGGYVQNWVMSGVHGASIGGGGAETQPNFVTDHYGTVGGGIDNQAGDNAGTVEDAWHATVGGGSFNTAGNSWATVGGGTNNTAIGSGATIGGGELNNSTLNYATVGGGYGNTASGLEATVGGGEENTATSYGATVAGGIDNSASGRAVAVGGGESNVANGNYATVAGGWYNDASNAYATVSGGYTNTASLDYATVSGGHDNIAAGDSATAGGGAGNHATGDVSTVGGGNANAASARAATVAGGDNNSAGGQYDTVGGGTYNAASGGYDTVAGGTGNEASGGSSAVGGGMDNTAGGTLSTVGGGRDNNATATWTTVSGGYGNNATGEYASVGGGAGNWATGSYSAIEGGSGNYASGDYSTIPGGAGCSAEGKWSFAAGLNAGANYDGCFAWGGGWGVSCTGINQFVSRAPGGYFFYTGLSGDTGAYLAPNSGSWSSMSDRNAKENVAEVDGRALLATLVQVPVTTWNYKSQDDFIRHIGPMAQDFYAAFGVGEDDKHITTVDADGVALAAIQALYTQLQEKDARIAALEEEATARQGEIAALQQQNAELDARLTALEQAAQGGKPQESGRPLPAPWLLAAGVAVAGGGGWAARRRTGGAR